MGSLAGKGMVVTGGAGDIGRAIAERLLDEQASVTLLDVLDEQVAEERVAPLRARGAVRYRRVDERDRRAVEHALAEVEPLDVVFGNAGIVESAPFLEITPQQWQAHLDINLTGCFHVTQASARLMVQRRRPGHIVLTGSWVQQVPWPEIAAYSASKAGLAMLARSAARELAPHGVRVNVLAPGIVDAGLARRQIETEPAYARRVAGVIPLGDLQTTRQVADAARFLASDEAAYMTGSVLLVDGGCSLFQFAEA